MKIITWNLNSVRAREDRLIGVLDRHKPDALCLQELKVVDDDFPTARVRELGYHAALFGQKTYNGVAILSRAEPEDVQRGLRDDVEDPQARLVSARIDGVRVISVYVPNGGVLNSDKYAYKNAWLKRLRAYLEKHHDPHEKLVLCGDINIAPDDIDVARPDEWKDTVLFHPEMRTALRELCSWGLYDAFRHCRPEAGLYSWWDYRQLGFPKGNGLRIDHIFVTEPLLGTCRAAEIDRNERKGKQPSDHAPVVIEIG
jgi:exodeoxyribonuclease-3